MSGPATGRPLRVAIFGESYLPYLSGVTVSTETLARGLRGAGHDVLLLAPRPADDAAAGTAGAPGPEPSYAWLPSYQAPPPAPPGYRMPWPVASAALRHARAFAPDIIHCQSPFLSGLMARRIAQQTRAPLVFTHHTRFGDYRHYLGPLGKLAAGTLDAYLLAFWAGCAAVIAPGSELASEIRDRLAGRRRPTVRVIPTGVDVAVIQAMSAPNVRAENRWPPNAIVVASLGRLAVEKDVGILVDAFAMAAAGDDRLRLLLVGDGPSREAIAARAARPDLAGRVALAGRLPHSDALAMVRGADVFAFASRTETQGLVLAEALACGLPVVALAGPGVADSVRPDVDGIIVPRSGDAARQPADLGAAIARLATDAERRATMATQAADGAGRFDVSRRLAEVVALYRELLLPAG
jgi:glycosyltransferase involved in cell wall biosynthesis